MTRTAWELPGGKPEAGEHRTVFYPDDGKHTFTLRGKGVRKKLTWWTATSETGERIFFFKGRERVNKKGHFGKPSP